MKQSGTGNLSASQMGHMPISGPNGSLELLKHLDIKKKIYVHINNTNPILIEGSDEKSALEASGCIVGEDGMELIV
jgi:pyrroloquinoline quinone biosynthesis protein B